MYHATGSSSSCANTATPRPQRRPVHNAHPAAATPPPMIANQAAVPKKFMPGCWAPDKPLTTYTTAAIRPPTPSRPTRTAAWRTVDGAGTVTPRRLPTDGQVALCRLRGVAEEPASALAAEFAGLDLAHQQ